MAWCDSVNVANICRRAIAGAFGVWRKVVKLREESKKQSKGFYGTISDRNNAIAATIAAVEEFKRSLSSIMNHFRENLSSLSIESRRFVGMLSLPLASSPQ